jgi:hypothetical protein
MFVFPFCHQLIEGGRAGYCVKQGFSPDRPYSDPEKAARKIVDIANAVVAVQDGRIPIEKINAPSLFRERATPAESVLASSWRSSADGSCLHESGTYVKFSRAGGCRSVRLIRYRPPII